jgi:DNA polymerase-3 subunit epsilon/CBS domain-containing protein
MAGVAKTTPLIALDAAVIDTETTGLDPGKARVVELAAVRLVTGRLDSTHTFRTLVQPAEPIPPAATRVHGIDQAAVSGAPSFAGVWPEFSNYAGDRVLIGHSIGFDITVLKRECARIDVAWQPPLSLDTRLLAEIAVPNLADYSLENLAAWLDVDVVGRHSALGDATTAARIFCALVPKLRDRGIRTLAEAVRASNALNDALAMQRLANWEEPAFIEGGARDDFRIDTYPYRHRCGEIMSSPPRAVEPDTPIRTALDVMARERISSLIVFPTPGHPTRPDEAGIITERDVLRTLSEHDEAALALPVSRAMSAPLVTIPADALAYLAIGRMNRLKIRHLGVTDRLGKVAGVLSARDLLRLRNQGAVELGDEIDEASDVHDLGLAWARLPRVASDLCREKLSGRDVAAVISHQLGETTRRAVALAERSMKDGGLGNPPCRYAFVVLGSAGRGESLLAMDQDNALIYEDDAGPEADGWFEALGVRAADILHQAGVPYCPGGVMAKNPQWRGSLGAWRRRVADWIRRSNPQDLLTVDIFFDLQGVHGEIALADTLWRDAFAAAKGETAFAKLLVEASGPFPAGLNWFGGLLAKQGRIDLKKTGLFPIVSTARALAICHHVTKRSTPDRLAGIKALGIGMETDLDAVEEAHALLLDLILRQQIEDAEVGRPPSNAVEIRRLSRRDKERLRAALRTVRNLDTIARDLLFTT